MHDLQADTQLESMEQQIPDDDPEVRPQVQVLATEVGSKQGEIHQVLWLAIISESGLQDHNGCKAVAQRHQRSDTKDKFESTHYGKGKYNNLQKHPTRILQGRDAVSVDRQEVTKEQHPAEAQPYYQC
ncbi:hypothetical protein QZH41_001893 [Actinostola sp. cb2023]|nr:hypothetical protein QZH41_001893 [Actinostola sp. cb2023]